jgi:hypothetical protein
MGLGRARLYTVATKYFDLNGTAVMKLSRQAASDVCLDAADRGLLVVKIEGGILQGNRFEARLDAIWDGADPPTDYEAAQKNNACAADFVSSRNEAYNAFIVTSAPIGGYPHRQTPAAERVDLE